MEYIVLFIIFGIICLPGLAMMVGGLALLGNAFDKFLK